MPKTYNVRLKISFCVDSPLIQGLKILGLQVSIWVHMQAKTYLVMNLN